MSGVALLSAVSLMVALAEAAGLTYSAGYDWLVLGLGAGAVVAARGESAIETAQRVSASTRPIVPTSAAEGTC